MPLEMVNEIIEDSIKAPNSQNLQPWSFIIVQDKDLMKKLSDSSKAAMIEDIEKEGDPVRLEFASRLKSNDMNVFYNAPCLVYVVGQEGDPALLEKCTGRRWIQTRRPDLYGPLAVPTGAERDTRSSRFEA